MKFNFRKIASTLTSAAMVGSTVALAAAASFPEPFVEGGNADVAVVYGSSQDLAAVTDISTALNAVTTGTGSSEAPTEGDYFKIAKPTNELNLGDAITSVYGDLDVDQLPVVLAEGVYVNDNNEEFDFTQQIDFSTSLQLTHFQDDDFNGGVPAIGMVINQDDSLFNYTLEFTTDAEGGVTWDDSAHYFEGSTLEMLGKQWYVLDVDGTTNGVEMDLLDSAASATVYEGETVTVPAGDLTYEISIGYIDSQEVTMIINGESVSGLGEGSTKRLADGSYIGIRDIGFQGFAGGIGLVEFSIGSGKLELKNGLELELNGDAISDDTDFLVNAYFTNTSQDLEELTLEWIADEDMWLAPGYEIEPVGFSTIKLMMTDFFTPSVETSKLTYDGTDSYKFDTEVKDGEVTFNLLYTNASGTGIDGLGDSATKLLITSNTSELYVSDYDNLEWFVASWVNGDDYESYVLYVSGVDDTPPDKNATTIKSRASSQQIIVDIGETKEMGEISFTLNHAERTSGVVNLTVSATAGTVSLNKLYTADGLQVLLPWNDINADATKGGINLTADPTTFLVHMTEEDQDGNIGSGDSFNATLGISSAETTVSAVSVTDYETTDDSQDYEGYVASELATRTLLRQGGDQDDLLIDYHDAESYGNVYVAQSGAATGSTGGGLSLMDTELAGSSMKNKNLIVVGGSCVNSAAATLLGVPASTCGDAWTAQTGAGAGSYIIETFDNPWSASTKVATLVAGYEKEDTANAATYLTTQNPTTDSGTKYTGTTGTSATMVA